MYLVQMFRRKLIESRFWIEITEHKGQFCLVGILQESGGSIFASCSGVLGRFAYVCIVSAYQPC